MATVDKKLFAPVARATNAIYMYVTDADTYATITGSNYFNDKELAGSVKVGDVVIVNSTKSSGGGFGLLTITAVDPKAGTITASAPALKNTAAAAAGG